MLKFIAKTIGKLVCTAILGLVGFFGWNWWGQTEQRNYSDIGSDWFASIKSTDFSKNSIEALVKDTGHLLKEATEVSRTNGREATKAALTKMADSLKQKMQEASAQGKEGAHREFEKLYDDVIAKLK
jgi:predicted negative regulator of RcsB-dependent stress response